jgi:hypothetical protein
MKRLTLSLLLIGLSLPTLSGPTQSEPNTPATELTFKVYGGKRIDWTVSNKSAKRLFVNPDVNIPPYVAELWLHKEHPAYENKQAVLESIKNSSVLQELSKQQQDFLDTGYAIWVDYKAEHLCIETKPFLKSGRREGCDQTEFEEQSRPKHTGQAQLAWNGER